MNKYCERYDVMYNPENGEYLESKCSDPQCIYCNDRPKHLSKACNDCAFTSCQGLRTKKINR